MRNSILPSLIIIACFAAYSLGQSSQKNVQKQNCCCEHIQQIAEDLRWIREQRSKPYVPPPDIVDPGNPTGGKGFRNPGYGVGIQNPGLPSDPERSPLPIPKWGSPPKTPKQKRK